MEDELETELEVEGVDDAEGEVSEQEPLEEGDEGASTGEDEGDEDVVQIGDEAAPASEEGEGNSEVFADLRRRYRETQKELARLRAKESGGRLPAKPPVLPPKPTLASCEYDEEKFQADTDAWYAKKREVDAHEASQKDAEAAQRKAAQAIDEHYDKCKAALKVKYFQDAEDACRVTLDGVQQALIKQGASNPALVVAALGKNQKKLSEMASIKDPVKFAVALGKLETEVKVTKRTSGNKPAPESTVRGGSGSAPANTATLERLEADAARTGDRSKVIAYKRSLKARGK